MGAVGLPGSKMQRTHGLSFGILVLTTNGFVDFAKQDYELRLSSAHQTRLPMLKHYTSLSVISRCLAFQR